jgi:Mycothiol maleylpyruvate isomerase N-terminal domain
MAVLALYEEGVSAIEELVRSWSPDRWRRSACGTWNGIDVAGHLVCDVAAYHAWLDRAEAGDATAPFTAAEGAARNEAALSALPVSDGPDRIELFAQEARRYARRVVPPWDLAYGFPFGTITVGLHAGLAAGEWHLHAWDLSAGAHRPRDARQLFRAVGAGMTGVMGRPHRVARKRIAAGGRAVSAVGTVAQAVRSSTIS